MNMRTRTPCQTARRGSSEGSCSREVQTLSSCPLRLFVSSSMSKCCVTKNKYSSTKHTCTKILWYKNFGHLIECTVYMYQSTLWVLRHTLNCSFPLMSSSAVSSAMCTCPSTLRIPILCSGVMCNYKKTNVIDSTIDTYIHIRANSFTKIAEGCAYVGENSVHLLLFMV